MELASDRPTMARGGTTATDPGSEITALRQDLEQLRRSRDKLGDAIEEFVAELAHDIKNPIGAMRISVQGLKRSLENGKRLENEQLAERLARLEGSLNQMSDVIASARARLSGKTLPAPELCREAVDLLPCLGRVVDELCASTGQQRISLDHQCTSLVGLWDARALCSAVQKLIDNAVKFSPGGEKVSVQVRRLDNQQLAEIIVRDQGIGIPASDLAHVC